MCGSPARIGLAVVVREPARAQQLDPTPPPAPGRSDESATSPGKEDARGARYGATAAHASPSTDAERPEGSGISVASTAGAERGGRPARKRPRRGGAAPAYARSVWRGDRVQPPPAT